MIQIENDQITVTAASGDPQTFGIGSPEGFKILSDLWLRSGWDTKYVYSFSWLGRPMIQLPEDMIRLQEVIYDVKPDVLIETGIAHGGSLIFYASLFHAMGKGRVVGIDIEIRKHNRQAIEAHRLTADYITMFEGSSIAPAVVDRAKAQIKPGEKVMVTLDSNHSYDHVLAELEAYAPLVSVGSYIVAMDGIMGEVVGAPRTEPDWVTNNPTQAAKDFVVKHNNFRIAEPAFPFNEGHINERVTYWPGAFILRES